MFSVHTHSHTKTHTPADTLTHTDTHSFWSLNDDKMSPYVHNMVCIHKPLSDHNTSRNSLLGTTHWGAPLSLQGLFVQNAFTLLVCIMLNYYTALQNVPKSTVDLNGPSQRLQENIS